MLWVAMHYNIMKNRQYETHKRHKNRRVNECTMVEFMGDMG